MKLKNKTNVLIAKSRELALFEIKHIGAIKSNRARVWAIESAYDLQKRSFASTTWTHDADYLARCNVKIDSFEHFERIVGFVYVGDFYHNLVTFFVTFVIAQK